MNPMEYKNIVQYKVSKEYPPKFSKTDKFLLRRKSYLYVIEDRTTAVRINFGCGQSGPSLDAGCDLTSQKYKPVCGPTWGKRKGSQSVQGCHKTLDGQMTLQVCLMFKYNKYIVASIIQFAECILDGLPLVFDTSPTSVNNMREAIAVYLLMNTDDLTNLCHICGDHTGDTLSGEQVGPPDVDVFLFRLDLIQENGGEYKSRT
ncbi:uncharacterized protein V6R79_019463 [Siganus canaliculatus]